MVFNSFIFVFFFALFFAAYWLGPRRFHNHLLVVGSYIFYGWWDYRFLSLIAISTVIDFFLGSRIHRQTDDRKRKRLLWCSVLVNLGILGTFKYLNFFTESLAEGLESLGVQSNISTLEILLPVGISFYTFQTISYSFDIFRYRIEPTKDFVTFAAYVSYFPQLVAGPIERARDLLPQLQAERRFPSRERRAEAASLIAMGLLRKIVIADGLATVVNETFDTSSEAGWISLAIACCAFALQIYGDFAGYTDIARGVSLLLGIELSLNFRQPHLARNITEFWRLWHISLSNWLRDYLYVPLGGNRGSEFTTFRNLIITMTLGGLWHGASWNFAIWGLMHGLALALHRWIFDGKVSNELPRLREIGPIAATFSLVALLLVLFRSETLSAGTDFLVGLFTFRSGAWKPGDLALLLVLGGLAFGIDIWQRRDTRPALVQMQAAPGRTIALTTAAVVSLVIFSGGSPEPFIYFQF